LFFDIDRSPRARAVTASPSVVPWSCCPVACSPAFRTSPIPGARRKMVSKGDKRCQKVTKSDKRTWTGRKTGCFRSGFGPVLNGLNLARPPEEETPRHPLGRERKRSPMVFGHCRSYLVIFGNVWSSWVIPMEKLGNPCKIGPSGSYALGFGGETGTRILFRSSLVIFGHLWSSSIPLPTGKLVRPFLFSDRFRTDPFPQGRAGASAQADAHRPPPTAHCPPLM
jgi:hypothetical protein